MIRSRVCLLLVPLVAACAQVRDPTGGGKDTTGPELVSALPAPNSTRFSGQRIELVFSERVKLNNVREHMLISPPLGVQPEVRMVSGNAAVIELKEPLAPNTTYTFNLGDAVVDLAEGNPAADLNYVISTGDHLDSASLEGDVLNAFTGMPEKEVLVQIYAKSDTDHRAIGAFRSGRPSYFARADEQGRFRIDHVRPGTYWCTGLRDQNANYRYDLPNEEIAFLEAPIELSDSGSFRADLRLFREPGSAQRVLGSKMTLDGALEVVLSRGAGMVEVKPVEWNGGNLMWWVEARNERDTLLLWPSDTTLLSGRRFVLLDDTVVVDTLRYGPLRKVPFNLAVTPIALTGDEGTQFLLHTSRPVARLDMSRMKFGPDGKPLDVRAVLDSSDRRVIHLEGIPAQGTSVNVELLPKAIFDDLGGYNDTVRTVLGAPLAEERGDLRVRITGDPIAASGTQSHFLLQLLNAQQGAVRELAFTAEPFVAQWNALLPGTYGLKVIADANGNGRWDPGSLQEGQAPEMVWTYSSPINVRARWDVETEWKF